jgi:exosortase B
LQVRNPVRKQLNPYMSRTAIGLPLRDRTFVVANTPWILVAIGLAVLYLPTLSDLATSVWASDEQGHGPVVLAVSVWLIWRSWDKVNTTERTSTGRKLAWPMVAFGAMLYAIGRSQDILGFEVGSSVIFLIGIVLLLRGTPQLKAIWFPLFFMLFMVPLPGAIVDTLTQPMKMAVSYIAAQVLYDFGYPIARAGVVLHIGPYQLLVADACAGLNTLFTLEALGLLYLNIVRSSSWVRNVALAVLVVPISFTANVIRVMVLTLITYHFGDAAGQGFLHGFSGMVLFLSALFLIISSDSLLRLFKRNLEQ